MDISICITTYNHEKFIERSINGIFDQDFDGTYEIVIGDDNSSDKTGEIINSIIHSHPKGNTIKYIRNNPNLGYVKNTLKTFENASGKYIAILDGDDYWIYKGKLRKQFEFLEKNEEFSAVGTDSLVVYEDLNKQSHGFTKHGNRVLDKNELTDIKICQTSTLFFRKSMLKEGFPTDIISADRCLYLLAGCSGKMKIFPEQTSAYRQFSSSLSRKVRFKDMQKDFSIIPYIKKNGPDYELSKLKTYFYYTLMSYSTSLTKLEFMKAASGYFLYNLISKFSFNPLKMYGVIKWGLRDVRNKYNYQKVHSIIQHS